MLNTRDYITFDNFKALSVICKRNSEPIADVIPLIKVCHTDTSKFYYKVWQGKDVVLFYVEGGKQFDAQQQEIDIAGLTNPRSNYKQFIKIMDKRKKEIVLLTFM